MIVELSPRKTSPLYDKSKNHLGRNGIDDE